MYNHDRITVVRCTWLSRALAVVGSNPTFFPSRGTSFGRLSTLEFIIPSDNYYLESCGCSSIGRAPAFQVGGCAFKSRHPHRVFIEPCRSEVGGIASFCCREGHLRLSLSLLGVAQMVERLPWAQEASLVQVQSPRLVLGCSYNFQSFLVPHKGTFSGT